MAVSIGGSDDEPMMDINTTPLIDVMLVLLIMFIITIPVQTHAVKLDLPVDDPNNKQKPPIDPVKNEVTIDPRGVVYWNTMPIDVPRLRQYLELTQQMSPIPELHLRPDPQARYVVVDQVLAETKRANVEKMGFVGNEQYAAF